MPPKLYIVTSSENPELLSNQSINPSPVSQRQVRKWHQIISKKKYLHPSGFLTTALPELT